MVNPKPTTVKFTQLTLRGNFNEIKKEVNIFDYFYICAYFTDSVATHSVIVAGSVSIKQYETDRNGNPTNYSDILLLPAVTTNTVDETKVINGNSYNFKIL